MNEEFKPFVPDVTFELIPIKNLVSNQEYQRNLSIGHIKRTAANFDLRQINLVKVSRRNGVNYVFNGQHTIETVALVSNSRDTPVWCMIYNDLAYEEEADIFANQMRFVKRLSPYEVFMANIEAGNDMQLTIKALIESYSLSIADNTKSQRNICAVATLEYIFEKYGYHALDQTLYLCISTWEGDPNSLSGNMLRGVSLLLHCYGDNLHQDLFVEKLGFVSPKEIARCAQERHNGSLGYAEAILTFYNKKTKSPLRWNLLYRKNASDTKPDEPFSEEQGTSLMDLEVIEATE